jgi:olefin beta-lactone synthetase
MPGSDTARRFRCDTDGSRYRKSAIESISQSQTQCNGRAANTIPAQHDFKSKLEANRESDYRDPIQDWSAESAIIFTTGSTGPPKGVLYSHKTFLSQIELISSHYGIERGGIDLSCFPLFGFFNAVMGTTTILPDMDPTRPADVDPPRLLDAIDHWQINQSFGSPALWNRLGRYCEQTGRKVPSLTRVLSAGAPVPPNVMQRMRNAIHPDAMFFTPYGATEALANCIDRI